MPRIAKIAISLPEDILEAVETERKASSESRSEFIRRAIILLLKEKRERILTEQYVREYQRIPETREEADAAYRAASDILGEEPWE